MDDRTRRSRLPRGRSLPEPPEDWGTPALVAELAEAGIHPIHVPTPFGIGDTNVYLLDDDPRTLIDAGPAWIPSLEALEGGLAAAGWSLADIGLVVVTHQHLDHEGLAGFVARRSGADVACLDLLAGYLRDFDESFALDMDARAQLMRSHGVSVRDAAFARSYGGLMARFGGPALPTVTVANGDSIRLRDRTVRCLFRPGHSPSDTVLIDEARRIMFAGDHLLASVTSNALVDRSLADGVGVVRTRALLAYRSSLAATRELDLRLVLPGHGGPIRDHRELIDERLARQAAKADRLLALLDEPKSAHRLARDMWGGTVDAQPFLTLSEVLGHLDLLVDAGSVVEHDLGATASFSRVR